MTARRPRASSFNLQSLGGRRFLLCVLAQAATALLQWFGKLDSAGNAYMLVILGTAGAFIAGNVVENKHNINALTAETKEAK